MSAMCIPDLAKQYPITSQYICNWESSNKAYGVIIGPCGLPLLDVLDLQFGPHLAFVPHRDLRYNVGGQIAVEFVAQSHVDRLFRQPVGNTLAVVGVAGILVPRGQLDVRVRRKLAHSNY